MIASRSGKSEPDKFPGRAFYALSPGQIKLRVAYILPAWPGKVKESNRAGREKKSEADRLDRAGRRDCSTGSVDIAGFERY